MTDLAGRLDIELRRTAQGFGVDIRSSRPVNASRVFVGKGVDETASGLPALFSICSTAQAAACAAACEMALGLPASPPVARVRGLLVDAETVREHLWRMLLDWPRFLGSGPDGPAMARVMGGFSRLRAALAGSGEPLRPGSVDLEPDLAAFSAPLDELAGVTAGHVLGQAPDVWLRRIASAQGLRDWAREADTVAARMLLEVDFLSWATLGRSPITALPPLSALELDARLGGRGADAFIAAPVWEGAPAESSPYSRNRAHAAVAGLAGECGSGLLPRLAAQLVELASLLVGLRAGIGTLGRARGQPRPSPVEDLRDGVGIAQVQAARGLLVHRVVLRDGRVSDYRILAPTEWNFHPRGAVAAGLAGMPDADDDDLRRRAGLFVTAVDPCVEYDVTIV